MGSLTVESSHTQTNGLTERKNRHILEVSRALHIQAHLPLSLWIYLVMIVAYLISLLPSSNTSSTSSYQLLYHQPPNGSLCFSWLQPYATTKLSPRSLPCVFIGFATEHKDHYCLNPATDYIYTSRHVRFIETSFPYATRHPPSQNTSTPTRSTSTLYPYLFTPALPTSPPPHIITHLPNPSTETLHPQYQPPTNLPSPSHSTSQTTIKPSPQDLPTQPSSSSPSPTSHFIPPPHHPMVTRLHSGYLKPRTILNLHSTTDDTPTSYHAATKHSHCVKPCPLNFQPSSHKAHGTSFLLPQTKMSSAPVGLIVLSITMLALLLVTKFVL